MSNSKNILPPMPPNISQLARDHGTSRETIRRLRDHGIDLSSTAAITVALAASRAKGKSPTPAPSPPGSESYAEAKRRRATADANLAEMKAAQQMGKLIDLATVEQAFAEIGFVLRARLLALPSNLVAELEGLTGAQIHKVLQNHVHQLLHDIHENSPIEKLTAANPITQDTTATKDTGRGQ